MNRKLSLIVFSIICTLLVACLLAACVNVDNPDTDGHVHTFDAQWSYDADYHWHRATCEHVDEIDGKAEHSFDGDVCLVCDYRKDAAHTVTYKANGGILSGQSTVLVPENSLLDMPAVPTRKGYVFDGWAKENGDTRWDFAIDRVTENITLYAQWLALFSVTFDANGGRFDAENDTYTAEVTQGGKLSPPLAPQRDNYQFTHWYTDDTLTTAWDFEADTVTQDTTIYAGWQYCEIDVTYVLNYTDAADVTAPTVNGLVAYLPSRAGYVFNGWWISDGQTADGEYILAEKWDTAQVVTDSGLTLYAEWVEMATVSTQLPAPSVSIDGAVFSWPAITDAVRYDVRVYPAGSSQELTSANVSGTTWTFPNQYNPGYYQVKIRAIGDGVNTVNSAYVTKSYGHLILGGISNVDFDISTSVLTWTGVKNATAYRLYVDDQLVDTLTYTTYDLSTYEAGTYQIKISATAPGYQSSVTTKSVDKKRLKTPEITVVLDKNDNSYILLWDSVRYADTYIIYYGDSEIRLTGNQYRVNDASPLWQGMERATIQIASFDSNADYLISLKPADVKLGKASLLTIDGVTDQNGSVVTEGEIYDEVVSVSQSFTITFDLNYSSSVPVERTVTSEQGIEYYIPSREGYVFTGWYQSKWCEKDEFVNFKEKITADTTVYAGWYHINESANATAVYSIVFEQYYGVTNTYTVNAKGLANNQYIVIYYPVLQTLRSAFYFEDDWSFSVYNETKGEKVYRQKVIGGSEYYYSPSSDPGDVISVKISSNYGTVSLRCYNTLPDITCDWLTCYGTNTQSDSQENSIPTGSKTTITAETKAGHAWMGWYEGDNLLTRDLAYTFTMPSNGATYSAKWTTLTITGNSEVAGTVTSLEGTYVYDQQVTISATTNERYAWQGWYDGDTLLSTDTTYTFRIPDTDITYTAKWTMAIQYRDENGQIQSYDGADIQYFEDVQDGILSRWYYVSGEQGGYARYTVSGSASIILADGCNLCVKGIEVPVGATLYIYAQSAGDAAGILDVDGNIGGAAGSKGTNGENGTSWSTSGKAGVAGTRGNNSGTIIINGGVIKATNIGGGNGGYGGGGGSAYSGSSGTAADGYDGANGGSSEKIVINGGVIRATNIGGGNGGNGGFGGIGNTYSYSHSSSGDGGNGGYGGNSGIIEINGGTVTADTIGGGNGGNGNSGYVGGNGGGGGNSGIIVLNRDCLTKSFLCGKAGTCGKTYASGSTVTDGSNGNRATVYFEGTEQQWQDSFGGIDNVDVYFYSATEPVLSGKYWYRDDDGRVIEW